MSLDIHTFRLRPGQELRSEIEKYCASHNLQSVSVVTCVAGVKDARLRMAGATPTKQDVRHFEGEYEVVSLVGTVAGFKPHLHISMSDIEGRVFGGHLRAAIVVWTAEITLMNDSSVHFKRELDTETGFKDLVIH